MSSHGEKAVAGSGGRERSSRPPVLPSQLIDRAYRHYVHFSAEYLRLLDRIHQQVVPRTYVEIGVFAGATLSLVLPGTTAIGVDPAPKVRFPLGQDTRVFSATSDDFFAENDVRALLGGRPVDLAFIDGMHLFEYALRDFMNIERYAHRATSVLIHDCYPVDEASAQRQQVTPVWTGDVWKLLVCLKQWRPDLHIATVDVAPAGLGIISGLDPGSTVLADHYEEIVEHFLALPFSYLDDRGQPEALNAVANDWETVRRMLPGRQRPFSVSGYKARRALRGAARVARRRYRRTWRRLKKGNRLRSS